MYKRVLQEGLLPRSGRGISGIKASAVGGRLYFWKDYEGAVDDAADFARQIGEERKDSIPSSWGVLEIDLPDGYKLRADPDFRDSSLEGLVVYGRTYIPPKRIRLLKVLDPKDWAVPSEVSDQWSSTRPPSSPPRPYGGHHLVDVDNPRWVLFQDMDEETQELFLKAQRESVRLEGKYYKSARSKEGEQKLKEFEEISQASQLIE